MKTTDKPILQDFHLLGVKHISPEDAREAKKNNETILVDVREEHEINHEHIENVLFLPMRKIADWQSVLPMEQNIIFICNKGIRSTHVAHFLMKEGFTCVFNMDGGLEAWKAQKLPYV